MEYELKHYYRVKYALVCARQNFLKYSPKDDYEEYAIKVIGLAYSLILNKIDELDGTNEWILNIARRILKSAPRYGIINSERMLRNEKDGNITYTFYLDFSYKFLLIS